jgi:hypothetical protein
MTIYERLEKIRNTYLANAIACKDAGLNSSHEIIMNDVYRLDDFIADMPIDIADMYAGENE